MTDAEDRRGRSRAARARETWREIRAEANRPEVQAEGNRLEARIAGGLSFWRVLRTLMLMGPLLLIHGFIAVAAARQGEWAWATTFPLSLLAVGLMIHGGREVGRAKDATVEDGRPMRHHGGLWQLAAIVLMVFALWAAASHSA